MPVSQQNPPPTPTAAGTLTAYRPYQTGSVAVAITDTAKTVALGSSMGNTNYTVYFEPVSGVLASFGISAKTPTSFVLMSPGVALGSTTYRVDAA